MKVAIDIDGVLYPLHEVVRDYLVDYGYIKKGSSVKSAFNFLKNKNRLFIDDFFSIPEIYERRLPSEYIISQVEEVYRDGAEIVYLTKRPERIKRITYKFLSYFPAPYAVFFVQNKQEFCRVDGVHVILDDLVENLINHTTNTLPLCVQSFDHPYVIEPRFRKITDAYKFAKKSIVL